MMANLHKVMKLNRHNSLLKTGRIEESLAEHQAIMDGNPPAKPAAPEVEFSKKEVLREEIEIY